MRITRIFIFAIFLLRGITAERKLSVGFAGLVVDRPRIQVWSYRVRNQNPLVINEECAAGPSVKGIDGYEGLKSRNCDPLVDRPEIKRLGQGDGELREWSIPQNVTQLTLRCINKNGPVEWDYQGKGRFMHFEIENKRITGDFWSPLTYTHESDLILNKVDDQLTGTFICRNVEKMSVLNSFYMFVPQEKLPILSPEEKVVLTPSSYDNTIIIPCRTEEKDASIHLYKRMKDGTLKLLNFDSSVDLSFNPYVGFELNLGTSSGVFGHYVCKIDKEGEEERRIKRDTAIIETSTSPGFLAFPTSEELVALMTPEELMQQTEQRLRIRKPPSLLTRWRTGGAAPQFQKRVGIVTPEHGFLRPRPPRPFHGPFKRVRIPIPSRPMFHHHPAVFHAHNVPVPVSFVAADHINEADSSNKVPIISDNSNFTNTSSEQAVETTGFFQPPIEASFPPPHYPTPTGSPMMNQPYPPPHFTGHRPIIRIPLRKRRPTIRPFAPSSSEEVIIGAGQIPQKEHIEGEPSSVSLETISKLNETLNKKPPKRGALLSPNLLPQTMNIMNSMGCVIKKVMLGPDASCNSTFLEAAAAANAALSRHPITNKIKATDEIMQKMTTNPDAQKTILEVELRRPPENKFFPTDESTIYTIVPFFVKWQTKSTDFSNWAEVNHTLKSGTFKLHKAGHLEDDGIHSFEVFNLPEGESGSISVPYVDAHKNVAYHTWNFVVINSTTAKERGLRHTEDGSKGVFTCRSSTANKPKLSLVKLMDDGCPVTDPAIRRKLAKRKSVVEEDCGQGCAAIRTDVETGIVHCKGDGVEQSLRFPSDIYCTGRPYFVERGKIKNMTLSENQKKLILPCIINNPNADVYLFYQDLNGTIIDVTDLASYDLKTGFTLSLDKMETQEPLGKYACTSTTNIADDSDMVTYNVNPASPHVFNPPHENVFGSPPFRFVWESVEELEVENKTLGNFYSGVFAKPEGNRPFVGTFEIASVEKGDNGIVKIVKSKDKEVVHTWRYAYKGKYGLWVDKKLNVFKCRSTLKNQPPSLYAVQCANANECDLKKRFAQDDLHNRDRVECGDSCTELKIWRNQPFGFVKCSEGMRSNDGMEDSLNYFLSKNSTLLTESDNLEEFKGLEISGVVRHLRVGESISFSCRANKYFYSKGFLWAVELKNGTKRFLDAELSRDTDSYLNEIRSEISLKIENKDWKAVYCYAPLMSSNRWGEASQLLYIY